jgi:hypothetical protein
VIVVHNTCHVVSFLSRGGPAVGVT